MNVLIYSRHGQMIYSHSSLSRSVRADKGYIPDLYDLYDLAHDGGWEPYNLHDLGRIFWVGYVLVLNISCTTSHTGRVGSI